MVSTSSKFSVEQSAGLFHATPTSNQLKRRNSASSEDCQSLQSSLKRVRLSCSPGELRLQRDLRELTSLGWQQLVGESRDTADAVVSLDSNPRWYFPTGVVPAELHVLDAHRLVLYLQLPTTGAVGRIWIQFPRMYPHRPPTVTRLEGLWMDQILIQDAPPSGKQPETPQLPASSSSSSSVSSSVQSLVYPEWSPVRNLGELLQFFVEHALRPPTPSQVTSSASTSVASSRANSPLTTLPSTVKRSQGPLPQDDHHHHHHHDGTINSMQGNFLEEHKMEDLQGVVAAGDRGGGGRRRYDESMDDREESSPRNNKLLLSEALAPNRFDVGYGKYHDPLAQGGTTITTTTTTTMAADALMAADSSSPRTPCSLQDMAMEMS